MSKPQNFLGSKLRANKVSKVSASKKKAPLTARRDRVGRFRKLFNGLHPIVRRLSMKKQQLALMKASYFDAKSPDGAKPADLQTEIALIEQELKLAVAAIRAGLGDKPIRMRLTASFVIATTVTTGVTKTVTIGGGSNALAPNVTSEWSTVAALFEEYKTLGCEAVFNYINPTAADAKTSITSDSMPVMAYDADDATSASSSLALTQAAQHKIFDSYGAGTPGTYVWSASKGSGVTNRFSMHVPRGPVEFNNNNSADPGTGWLPVNAAYSCGFLKFYHVGQENTAVNTGAGVVYFDLEFRCRS